MSSEAASLFVSLSAKTQQYTSAMNKADERMNKFKSSVGTNTKKVSDSFDKTGKSAKSFGQSIVTQSDKSAKSVEEGSRRQVAANERTRSSMAQTAKSIIGLAGAFYAYEWAKDAVKDTTDLTLATYKLQAVTHMTTKTTSTWIEALKGFGVSAQSSQMGFISLSKQIAGAEQGSKKSSSAFKDLGVSMATLKSGDVNRVILDVADGLHNMKNKQLAAADAQLLFSRNAKAMLPVLGQGKDAVQELLKSTQSYGAFIGGNTYKQLLRLKIAQIEFNHAMEGLKIAFTVAVMPYLSMAATAISKFIVGIRDGTGVGGQFASVIGTAFNTVKGAITGIIGVFGGWKNAIEAIGIAWGAIKIVNIISGVAGAFAALGSPAMLGIVALAAGAYLIVSNWKTVGPFLTKTFNDIKVFLAPVIDWMKTAFNNVVTWFKANWPGIRETVVQVFTAITNAIGAAVKWIITAFTNMVNFLKPIVKSIGDTFSPVVAAIVTGVSSLVPVIGPAIGALVSIFKVGFSVMATVAKPVIAVLGAITGVAIPLLLDGFKTAWNVLKPIIGGIVQVIKGGFQVIKGIIEVFTGLFTLDFGKMWGGIKDIFSGSVKALVGIVKGIGGALFAAAKGIIGAIGDGISAAWKGVLSIMEGFINGVIDVVNAVLKFFHLGTIDHVGGGGSHKVASNDPGALKKAGFAHGGLVDRPGYFAGEEAPAHPEVIISTNPRDRKPNLGYWAKAGSMLGVPGFQGGGISGVTHGGALTGPAVGGVGGGILGGLGDVFSGVGIPDFASSLPKVPDIADWASGIPKAILGDAKKWIGNEVSKLGGGIGGVFSGLFGGKVGKSGLGTFDGLNVANWIIPILNWSRSHGWGGHITSGFRPGAITNTGHPSNHSMTNYPGGAVDVGDQHAAAEGLALWNVVKNYPGQPKLYSAAYGPTAWGPYKDSPHDYGHFSATGHMRGAIRKFAQGGIAYRVNASEESNGGQGYYGFSPGIGHGLGYSILSQAGNSHDAAHAGHAFGLPIPSYPNSLFIKRGKHIIRANVQDIGSGSDSNLPTVGLYPDAVNALGGSAPVVDIQRTDSRPFTALRGKAIPAFVGDKLGQNPVTGKSGKALSKKAVDHFKWVERLAFGKHHKYSALSFGDRNQPKDPSWMSTATPGAVGQMEGPLKGKPGILNTIIGSRKQYQELMDKYSLTGLPSGSLLSVDPSTGDWVSNPDSVKHQMKQLTALQNRFLNPAMLTLVQESKQTQDGIKQVAKWVATKIKGVIDKIKAEIKKAQAEITRLHKYIKDQEHHRGKHWFKNVQGAQGRVNELNRWLGNPDGSDAGSLHGALLDANTRKKGFGNTSLTLAGSLKYFNEESVHADFLNNLTPPPLVKFNSVKSRVKDVNSELDTIHQAMATLMAPDTTGTGSGGTGTTTTPALTPVDTSGLIQQQLTNYEQLYLVSQAQYKNFANAPYIGAFATGAKNIQMEGFGYLHQGEAVIPSDMNPFTNGAGGEPNVQVILNGDAQRFRDDVEVIVDGKKAEFTSHTNDSIGQTVGINRSTPSPARLAKY